MFKIFRPKIGIIGAGNMGSAIAERLKSRYKIFVFDKDSEKINKLSGVCISESNSDLISRADTVILAVKPQDFEVLLNEIKPEADKKLIITIAAGICVSFIEKILGEVGVIRVMPNLPARIGQGVSYLYKGRFASGKELKFALSLFGLLGTTFILDDENMMSAATAVSGSGPGFWGYRVEGMPKNEWRDYSERVLIPEFSLAAESVGFNKEESRLVAERTVRGSLATVEAWHITPGELRMQVASKGGTTEAGLEMLSKGGTLKEAVWAAKKRAEELSRE